MRHPIYFTALVALLAAGCAHVAPSSELRYQAGAAVPAVSTVGAGGDFALFYDANRKPEIPVRLRAGERIGFEKSPDGRVQAVAGAFRMNLSGEAKSFYWKRLNSREE